MTEEQQSMFQKRMADCSTLKSVQVLSALVFYKKECGIQDLASVTGLSNSTIHRILQEFTECGLAVKMGKKYRYGILVRSLFGELKDADLLLEAAEGEADRLNELTKETIHIIVRENMEAVYADKRDAKNQIGLKSIIGKRIPMYCTSGGKVLMAHQPPEWLEEYFATVPLTKLTENTVTCREELMKQLDDIKTNGYAVDVGEHNYEVVCVAAPVYFADGSVACTIGVSTPRYRMTDEKLRFFIEQSMRSARIITEKLK